MTSPAPWATVEDVTNITGKTVDQGVLDLALGVIEMKAGRTVETATRLTSASKEWLRRTVAYQAAWMADPANSDLLSRIDVTGISQDGVSATGASLDWQLIAPLARMALRRVKWRGTRSVDIVPAVGDRMVGPWGYGRRYAFGVGPIFDSDDAGVYDGASGIVDGGGVDEWRGL